MAKCQDCKREMTRTKTCTFPYIKIGNRVYKRKLFSYNQKEEEGTFCHDCGIRRVTGSVHHFGCDMERCPACGRQLISCRHGEKAKVRKTNRIVRRVSK